MWRWISTLPLLCCGGRASSSSSSPPVPPNATAPHAGPHRCVGNIFIVNCVDHPFKHGWELNRVLRGLRLEFMGQTTILPDIPPVRAALWRARAVVRVDVLDLDEAKALIGVPEHITFSDLAAQIPSTFGRIGGMPNPHIRSKVRFMQLRTMRLRDVLHRDALEKRLLEEKRRLHALKQQADAKEEKSTEGSEPSEEFSHDRLKQ
ncbi:unnamed protein product [Phytomonas sp. Hart1]|nr:unnamed protein product [Phytomonas sp. Hart1]|eukprot:CCW67540.1 unnamed protein product [Phytomonas sp. isolate Hart1]